VLCGKKLEQKNVRNFTTEDTEKHGEENLCVNFVGLLVIAIKDAPKVHHREHRVTQRESQNLCVNFVCFVCSVVKNLNKKMSEISPQRIRRSTEKNFCINFMSFVGAVCFVVQW